MEIDIITTTIIIIIIIDRIIRMEMISRTVDILAAETTSGISFKNEQYFSYYSKMRKFKHEFKFWSKSHDCRGWLQLVINSGHFPSQISCLPAFV